MNISETVFVNMTAGKQGGAIYCQDMVNMSISEADFISTKSSLYGDALYIYEAKLVNLTSISFEGFFHNAVYLQASPLILHDVEFSSIFEYIIGV